MGMLFRRHYATEKPEKPVKQTETESVKEVPEKETEQAATTKKGKRK